VDGDLGGLALASLLYSLYPSLLASFIQPKSFASHSSFFLMLQGSRRRFPGTLFCPAIAVEMVSGKKAITEHDSPEARGQKNR